MTTTLTLAQVIRRTERFRARFAALPRKAINLDELMRYRNMSALWRESPHLPCNSVGCLKGWGEVWYSTQRVSVFRKMDLIVYLGLNQFRTASSQELFTMKRDPRLSHRAEALARLDRRITELRQLQKGGVRP